MSSKDKVNISTLLTSIKDNLVGAHQPLVDKDGAIHLDLASPATISAEITRQIANIKAQDKHGFVGDTNALTDGTISSLQEKLNDVNAIRINTAKSTHSGVSEERKYFIASEVATGIIGLPGPLDIADSWNKRHAEVTDHLAAALGHRESLIKLAAQQKSES